MPKVIESMTKIELGPMKSPQYIVRVWRNEKKVQSTYDNKDLVKEAERLYERDKWAWEEIINGLASMERVNAVEITRPDGKGILIYPEWP